MTALCTGFPASGCWRSRGTHCWSWPSPTASVWQAQNPGSSQHHLCWCRTSLPTESSWPSERGVWTGSSCESEKHQTTNVKYVDTNKMSMSTYLGGGKLLIYITNVYTMIGKSVILLLQVLQGPVNDFPIHFTLQDPVRSHLHWQSIFRYKSFMRSPSRGKKETLIELGNEKWVKSLRVIDVDILLERFKEAKITVVFGIIRRRSKISIAWFGRHRQIHM